MSSVIIVYGNREKAAWLQRYLKRSAKSHRFFADA